MEENKEKEKSKEKKENGVSKESKNKEDKKIKKIYVLSRSKYLRGGEQKVNIFDDYTDGIAVMQKEYTDMYTEMKLKICKVMAKREEKVKEGKRVSIPAYYFIPIELKSYCYENDGSYPFSTKWEGTDHEDKTTTVSSCLTFVSSVDEKEYRYYWHLTEVSMAEVYDVPTQTAIIENISPKQNPDFMEARKLCEKLQSRKSKATMQDYIKLIELAGYKDLFLNSRTEDFSNIIAMAAKKFGITMRGWYSWSKNTGEYEDDEHE